MLTRKAWSGFALLALWLVLESAISWAGFCYEGQDERPEQYAGEADSCILRGPLALLIKGFFRWWARTFHDADAYVALFTALLFVSTVALWLSTRRLWRLTERTFTELEAPYLFVENGARFTLNPAVNSRPRATFALRNYGRTPATLIETRRRLIFVSGPPDRPDFGNEDTLGGRVVIGPDQSSRDAMGQDFIASREELSDDEVVDLDLDRKSFFVFGYARYESVFGETYRYGFGYRLRENGYIAEGGDAFNYRIREKRPG